MEDKIKEYLGGNINAKFNTLRFAYEKDPNKYFKELKIMVSWMAHDIAEIVEKDTPNIMIYQRQLEKQNTNLKDEIKHWQVSWDCIVKENAMLLKENKEALEAVEKLMNDNTELEATLDDNNLQIKNTAEIEKENIELKEQILKSQDEAECEFKQGTENDARLHNVIERKNTTIGDLEAKLILRNGRILELEQQIEYLDGVSMLNEDLIRKNDELKQIIETAPSDLMGDNMRLRKKNAELKDTIKFRDSSIQTLLETIDLIKEQRDKAEQQLVDIKYLDRDEIEKIFANSKLMYLNGVDYLTEFNKTIAAICNLAIKPISKDKIIEVLKNYKYDLIYYPNGDATIDEDIFGQIADEILNSKTETLDEDNI